MRQAVSAGERRLVERLVGFVRFLRGEGFVVGPAEQADALRLAAAGDLLHRHRLRWQLRALLCARSDDWQRFDELFDRYWLPPNRRTAVSTEALGASGGEREVDSADSGAQGPATAAEAAGAGLADAPAGASRGGACDDEALQHQDFQSLGDAVSQRQLQRLAERLARRRRRVRARRLRRSDRGRQLHLRQTLRNSLSRGGWPFDLAYRTHRRVLPRLVLLLDVSRSMETYSLMFLRFARALTQSLSAVSVFAFHTRLVPLDTALTERETRRVQEKLALLSQGFAGGTRIATSLADFHDRYGRLLSRTRTTVVVVSDGYDTDEPDRLAQSLQRIRERSRRLIWLNPMLGRVDYQPVAAGMQAALPHLDRFAPAHNLHSLMALETELFD